MQTMTIPQQQSFTRDDIATRIKPRLLSSEYQADRLESLVKQHIAADLWLTWIADMTGLLPQGRIPEGSAAVAPVTYSFAERFRLSIQDLLHLGYDNTHGCYSARPMGDILSMLCDASLPADDAPAQMYVLTNSDAQFGAAAVLDPDIQQQMKSHFGSKFYLLPSSTHEFICVPASGESSQAHELARMVHAINHDPAVMQPSDVLSDHIFCIENDSLAVVV